MRCQLCLPSLKHLSFTHWRISLWFKVETLSNSKGMSEPKLHCAASPANLVIPQGQMAICIREAKSSDGADSEAVARAERIQSFHINFITSSAVISLPALRAGTARFAERASDDGRGRGFHRASTSDEPGAVRAGAGARMAGRVLAGWGSCRERGGVGRDREDRASESVAGGEAG